MGLSRHRAYRHNSIPSRLQARPSLWMDALLLRLRRAWLRLRRRRREVGPRTPPTLIAPHERSDKSRLDIGRELLGFCFGREGRFARRRHPLTWIGTRSASSTPIRLHHGRAHVSRSTRSVTSPMRMSPRWGRHIALSAAPPQRRGGAERAVDLCSGRPFLCSHLQHALYNSTQIARDTAGDGRTPPCHNLHHERW